MRRVLLVLLVLAIVLSGCGQTDPTPTPKATSGGIAIGGGETATDSATTAPPTVAPTAAAPTAVPPTAAPEGRINVTEPNTVDVTALWYGTDASGNPMGGTSVVHITVEPNASQRFRVGFFEGEVAGSGPMWRASGWVAAIMSALLTGFNPSETQVSFDVGGRIDGPSAGGLMTVGILAALRGDTINPDAAMTGTINPDGTIGPVGGIPYKLQGAADAGKTLVMIPVGRIENGVDLIEHGRKLGIEVREVSDIFAAYKALTGVDLPRTTNDERPQLAGQVYDRLGAKAKEWLARYQEELAVYSTVSEDIRGEWLDYYLSIAADSAERSSRLSDQGMIAGAYSEAVNAAVFATIGAQTGRILETYFDQGIDGAIGQLRTTAAFDTKAAAVADRLKAEKPATLAAAGTLASSYGALIEALGLADMGTSALNAIPEGASDEDALGAITEAVLYLRMADLSLETAKDVLDMGSALGGTPIPADAPLADVAEFFRRASEANLNLFDTVVLAPLAQNAGLTLEMAQVGFGASDFSYSQARASLNVMPMVLDRYFGGGEASDYAQLGGALSAYSASTGLIAKYYSLDAQLDENLNVTGFGKERVLIDTLDLADARARASIAYLGENGVDPALYIVSYEAARLAREGDVWEKMDALTGFWSVYVECQALAYLGGFAGQ